MGAGGPVNTPFKISSCSLSPAPQCLWDVALLLGTELRWPNSNYSFDSKSTQAFDKLCPPNNVEYGMGWEG